MMISLARAGPTSRTKRVVDATPSGTPRSTSGIHSIASAAAHRKSQARTSPKPPPMAWPLIIAIVACSRFSSRVVTRSKRRRNWLRVERKTRRRSSADIELLTAECAPAEKTGGAPVTITTRDAVSSRSVENASISSLSISSLSEFRRSGRLSVTVAMGPDRERATFVPTLRAFDQDGVAAGAALTDRARLPVLRRIVPSARLREIGELKDDEPSRLPVSLECLHGTAAHQVAAAVLRHGFGDSSPVLLVSGGVGDLDIGDDVCGHGPPPRGNRHWLLDRSAAGMVARRRPGRQTRRALAGGPSPASRQPAAAERRAEAGER